MDSHGARLRRLCAGLVLIAAAVATGGCTYLSGSSVQAVRLAVGGGRLEMSPETVAANPHAQILVRGGQGEALMVLGNDDAGLLSWYSPDRRIVFLRGGLLVGTSGYPDDAADIRLLGDDPFARLLQLDAPVPTRRRYDWAEGYRYGVEVEGLLRQVGREDVEILGRRRTLLRFDETLHGPGVAATNVYWVEPQTGAIVRSRQLLAPGSSLEIVELKSYRPAVAP